MESAPVSAQPIGDPLFIFPLMLVGLLVVALVLMLVGMLCVTIRNLLFGSEEERIQAHVNEHFKVKAKVVFSHQRSSEQPVVVINTRRIPLFEFFEDRNEHNSWKRWVKASYEDLYKQKFPVYIRDRLYR